VHAGQKDILGVIFAEDLSTVLIQNSKFKIQKK
jgi:hypothetical protein